MFWNMYGKKRITHSTKEKEIELDWEGELGTS